jgi:antitoxin component of RelBE/YafQ-DinJ toxin-antitoxin module
MKTTIDIADTLLDQARHLAARRGTTVRSLVEMGLRQVIAESRKEAPFKLRDASFKGKGLQPGIDENSWSRLRDMAYEGRGT